MRRTKSDYYRNLDLGDVTDNRKFWKTVKSVFSNEMQTSSSVTLIGDGKMINDDVKIAEIFNHYFANITESLGSSEDQSLKLVFSDAALRMQISYVFIYGVFQTLMESHLTKSMFCTCFTDFLTKLCLR